MKTKALIREGSGAVLYDTSSAGRILGERVLESDSQLTGMMLTEVRRVR